MEMTNDMIFVGTDDFDKIMERKAKIIDKTMFIKEWMQTGVEVSVFLRPRRFGKSTNLSMLKSFFSFGAELKDFSSYIIGKETEFIEKHRGKYPVVLMTMKGVVGENWEEMLKRLWAVLRFVICDQDHCLDDKDIKIIGVDCYDAYQNPDESIAELFLMSLTRRLEKKCNAKVILLIDEYDAPLNHAFRKGYFSKASDFFGSFYSNGLKSNSSLMSACLMGIVELRGIGMLSGLNNYVLYSSKTVKFSQYFGFTRDEVSKFLGEDEKKLKMFWNGIMVITWDLSK
jgi:hypothetical protein